MGKTSPTFEELVAEARRQMAPEIERARQAEAAFRADPDNRRKRREQVEALRRKKRGRTVGDIVSPLLPDWDPEL